MEVGVPKSMLCAEVDGNSYWNMEAGGVLVLPTHRLDRSKTGEGEKFTHFSRTFFVFAREQFDNH